MDYALAGTAARPTTEEDCAREIRYISRGGRTAESRWAVERRGGRSKSSQRYSSPQVLSIRFILARTRSARARHTARGRRRSRELGAIVRTPVLHDPGKQVFYYVILHYYTRIFGLSEAFAAIAVGDLFTDDAGAGVRDRLRNVRRQHCARGGCDVGVQSARGCVRAFGANVFDADCFSARTTADALAGAQASEHERRSGMRYRGRRAPLHTPRRHPVYRSGRCDARARLPSRAEEIRWRGSRSL